MPKPSLLPPELAKPSEVFDLRFADGLKPDPSITVSQWADLHRYLSPAQAAEPGRWRTDRTPYLREIMDVLSDASTVPEVAILKGAQIGVTECVLNWIGYTIHASPCAFLFALPTKDLAEMISRTKLAPMIEEADELRARVSDRETGKRLEKLLEKTFPGGVLRMIGANSPSGLRSFTARRIALDDLDGFPDEAGEEGDPIQLAKARATTFARSKVLYVSTPTIEGRSKIGAQFDLGDQRDYFVPCPACDHFQPIAWPKIKWEKGRPDSVGMACEACGALAPEHAWKLIYGRGVWIPKFPERSEAFRSYKVSGLLSPLGLFKWSTAVSEFEAAVADTTRLKLKAFVNTRLGETWKERGDAPEWERLYERRERYAIGSVPSGGLVLTAGVDVQADRVEIEVVAWGRNRESWSVLFRTIPGQPESPATWNELARFLASSFRSERGVDLQIRAFAVDTGFATQHVYGWLRTQSITRAFGIKGTEDGPSIVSTPKAVEVTSGGKRASRGLRIWPVATASAKAELYAWLRLKSAGDDGKFPNGFCHFPEYGEEFFRQLTAEQVVVKYVRGYRRYQWEKTRERNEALDCRIYARAAAAIVGVDRWREEDWAAMEGRLSLEPKPRPPKKRRESDGDDDRRGYMDRWRSPKSN